MWKRVGLSSKLFISLNMGLGGGGFLIILFFQSSGLEYILTSWQNFCTAIESLFGWDQERFPCERDNESETYRMSERKIWGKEHSRHQKQDVQGSWVREEPGCLLIRHKSSWLESSWREREGPGWGTGRALGLVEHCLSWRSPEHFGFSPKTHGKSLRV